MKILVASDLHGSLENGKLLLERFEKEKADKLVLLGDLYYHGPRNPLTEGYDPMALANLLNHYKDKLFVIKGNCDSEVDEMVSEFKFHQGYANLDIGEGKTLTITHGHLYDNHAYPPDCGEVFLFGHIHTGFLERREDGGIVGNPGSVSLPKNGTPKSYLTIESSFVTLKTLDGMQIDRLEILSVRKE
ncbi:MAG: phosphodiesterase [Clostridia bacterium]|nr:phosphodiesterase [Clostridia bacterium]